MNTNERVRALREDILARYTSLHAFCKAHAGTLKRSTVYAVLAGRYAGDAEEQLARIRGALDDPGPERNRPTQERVVEVLQRVKCCRCRPVSRRKCLRCRERTGLEAQGVCAFLQQEEACRRH